MTKADKRRLDIIRRLPCVACVQNGTDTGMRVEAHHIVDRGYRKHSGGHQSTLPLCEYHHRGDTLPTKTVTGMWLSFGPSLARNKREFVKKYGTERELLERVNAIIG